MTADGQEQGGALNRFAPAGRWLFWLVLAFIAFVTLSPIDLRPETSLPPSVERFAAYLAVTLLCMVGYPALRLRCFLGLTIAAATLEAGQLLIPGRDARWTDFAVKAAGVLAGTCVVIAADRVLAARHRRQPPWGKATARSAAEGATGSELPPV